MACLRAPAATQIVVATLAEADAGAAIAAPPDADADPTEAADASDPSDPLDLLTPTGPILRERATVVVDGVAATWRLEWSEPPTPECATGEQFAMSCSCWGFTVAETGPLDLVRSRPNMPDERLALSPLFVGDRTRAILQRWKLKAHEPLPDDLVYLGMFRPAVTVMKLGDYDHDGRSTEFVLQIGASACFDVAVVVGISKSNPHLHVFGSAESPQSVVSLGHRAQWERLRTSSMIDVVQVPCGVSPSTPQHPIRTTRPHRATR